MKGTCRTTKELKYDSWQGQQMFLFCSVHSDSRAHLAYCSVDTGAVFSWAMHPRCEADHPLPSSAKFKNNMSCISTVLYAFIVWTRTTLSLWSNPHLSGSATSSNVSSKILCIYHVLSIWAACSSHLLNTLILHVCVYIYVCVCVCVYINAFELKFCCCFVTM